jgi:HAD superfamily hydrolase (TIGR01450 family)
MYVREVRAQLCSARTRNGAMPDAAHAATFQRGRRLKRRTAPDLKGILFDLDGTLVRGEYALPGAVKAVSRLRACGLRIAYCTQDSIKTPKLIAERLNRLGFKAAPADVITTGWLAARYLAERYRNEPVYMIGAPELRRAFAARGVNVVECGEAMKARAVFIARDPAFTAEHINAACKAIWSGAEFFGVGYDRVLPLAEWDVPGIGAVIKGIEHATRRRATILGKPSKALAVMALRRLNSRPYETVVVGDQTDTDIRMGKSAGCHTVLVLTGGTSAAQLGAIPPRWRADAVLTDVSLLPDWIAAAKG